MQEATHVFEPFDTRKLWAPRAPRVVPLLTPPVRSGHIDRTELLRMLFQDNINDAELSVLPHHDCDSVRAAIASDDHARAPTSRDDRARRSRAFLTLAGA